jgi:DNA-binding response OmpR family regulator
MTGERILVVEDEKTIAELVAEGLKRQGFRAEISTAGDTGLERI